jgi:nucleoside-diphosphate-sugar epimerase
MNIVIGSNGFLGSYIRYKCKNPINVISDNDINLNGIKYENFIKLWKIGYYTNNIVYICSSYQNTKKIIIDLQKDNNNTNNIFILFSSAVVYSGIDKHIYCETDNFNDQKSDDDYIKIVKNNETLFRSLCGIKIIIRLGTLYGSSPNLNASRGINRMIYFPLINNYIEIYDRNLKKSLTSFEDLWSGINIILTKYNNCNIHNCINNIEDNNDNIENNNEKYYNIDIYNISSFDTTIGILGNYISKELNVPIKYLKDKNNINYNFHLDTNKLKLLGWSSNGTLDNLIETICLNIESVKEIKYDDILIYYTKKTCRVCNSKCLFKIIDLKNQPPPNRLNDKFWKLLKCPLILNGCYDCYHLQLNGVLNPIIMYKDYSYLSGTSSTMINYFNNFIDNVIDKTKNTILDIACNDCALLDCFKLKNFKTYGIDPAENIVSNINNHNIYCGFLNINAVNYFKIKFEIVTAFNVFAHVDDIYSFLENIYMLTDTNSDIYIQTSQCNMIQNNEFDTIYHEHLSFFNINSMKIALNKANYYLNDVKIVDIHGSSYLFHIKHKIDNFEINKNIVKRLNFEINSNLYKRETYINYCKNIYIWKDNLINLLKNKQILIGVGASAKGITVLNFIKDDLIKNNIKIEFILDENSIKIGKKIDSLDINIVDFNYIKTIDFNITFIIFAWNYKDELLKKIKLIRNKNDKFIILFPDLYII